MRSLTFAVLLASCATPAPIPLAPKPIESASPPVAASTPAPTPAPTLAPSSVSTEHDGFLSEHWVGGDPDPACTRWAACYLAPSQTPEAPAAAPYAMCPERKLGMPLDPTYTRKLRKEQGFAACCYLTRRCKLPLRDE